MNILSLIKELQELEKKATKGGVLDVGEFNIALRNSFPKLSQALELAVTALEKINTTAPMQARTKLIAEEALDSISKL